MVAHICNLAFWKQQGLKFAIPSYINASLGFIERLTSLKDNKPSHHWVRESDNWSSCFYTQLYYFSKVKAKFKKFQTKEDSFSNMPVETRCKSRHIRKRKFILVKVKEKRNDNCVNIMTVRNL